MATRYKIATQDRAETLTNKTINEAKGADIASATTTDIGAATGNYVNVTGTTTITGLGTVQAGTRRIVNFTGALTLTHNATSLILPTAANITTAAGDTATFVSLGSGNWKCVSYDRASGAALATSGGGASQFAYAYRGTDQAIATTSPTKVQFNTEVYDSGSNYDNATNYRYTAPSTGYYQIQCHLRFTNVASANYYGAAVRVNNTAVAASGGVAETNAAAEIDIDVILSLTTSDYIEIFAESGDTSYSIAAANLNSASTDKASRLVVAKLA